MKVCNKCAEYGLKFKREYNPDEFLEGKPNSLIWIIGLNPKKDKRFKLPRAYVIALTTLKVKSILTLRILKKYFLLCMIYLGKGMALHILIW